MLPKLAYLTLCRSIQLLALLARGDAAKDLEVSAQAVSIWHSRWQQGGTEALHSRGPSGPAPFLAWPTCR